MPEVAFRWSLKAKWVCLGLGFVTAAGSIALFDVCTFDFLGNNPTERAGDMRLAMPLGTFSEILGHIFHDLLVLALIVGSVGGSYVGLQLAAVSIAGLVSFRPAVVISDQGVWNWYWSDSFVPWSAVRRIDGFYRKADGSLGVSTFVTFVVDDPESFLARAKPVWCQRMPIFVKQLSVSLVVLEDPVSFIKALVQHTPDFIAGVNG